MTRQEKMTGPTVLEVGKAKMSDVQAPLVLKITDEQAQRLLAHKAQQR